MNDKNRGLYKKYIVERTDGRSKPGQKHEGCDYFVLDLTHDKFSINALLAYSHACREEYPGLADDLLFMAYAISNQTDSPFTNQRKDQIDVLFAEISRLKEELESEKDEVELKQAALNGIEATLTAAQERERVLRAVLKKYLKVQRAMLERWAEGDEKVKTDLWQTLHQCEAEAEQALSSPPSPTARERAEILPSRKDEIINKALKRLSLLTGEDFHGYRSEVWGVVSGVISEALKEFEP